MPAVWVNWYRRLLPAYWVFLFTATHLPKLQAPSRMLGDKRMHLIGFFILAILLWKWAETMWNDIGPRFAWQALLLLALYGALDEATQPFFGRSGGVLDWVYDLIGAAVGLGVMELMRRRRSPRAAGGPTG